MTDVFLQAPDATVWQLEIDDLGALSTTSVATTAPERIFLLDSTSVAWLVAVANGGGLSTSDGDTPSGGDVSLSELVLDSPSFSWTLSISTTGVLEALHVVGPPLVGATAMRRWTFHEVGTATTYTHVINPNTMTSPFRAQSSEPMIENLAYRKHSAMKDWAFGGVVRSVEQYDALLEWSRKRGVILVTDHLGRQFNVYMVELALDEQKPTPRVTWRFKYTMNVLVIAYLGVTP